MIATNIITNLLRKILGLKITKLSITVFTMADGGKTPSLGSTIIKIEIENDEIPVKVQVIDSKAEDLLLGNEIFRKMKAIIDYDKKKMTMKCNDKEYIIPIYFTKKKDNETINSEIYLLKLNPTYT